MRRSSRQDQQQCDGCENGSAHIVFFLSLGYVAREDQRIRSFSLVNALISGQT
jgi:hypothetical protein